VGITNWIFKVNFKGLDEAYKLTLKATKNITFRMEPVILAGLQNVVQHFEVPITPVTEVYDYENYVVF
jgi:hypothetical protein